MPNDYAPPLTDADRAEIERAKARIAAERARFKQEAAERKARVQAEYARIMRALDPNWKEGE